EGGRRGRPLHRAPRRRAGAVAQGARRGPPRDRSRRARAARRPACARTGGTSRARAARPRRGEERGREGGRRGVCARGLDPPARGRRLATFRDLSQVPGGVVEFFLRRPIFASVCSLVILLLGLISIPILPIAQYPNIAPPTVTVTAVYTGASAEAVEASVTTPLEQAINTVQGLRYISSQSGSDGTSTITCTFNLDRDLDQAANDVQNAVNLAQGNIPNEVKQVGITVSKNSGTFVMAIGVTSTDPRWDPIYMTNYLENNVTNDLQRVSGVSQVLVFGERKYAMRLWIDPKRLADNQLTAADVVNALEAQNVQVAAGAIGAPPTNGHQPYEYGVRATGRLRSTTQFANIILRANPDGGFVRVRDVGRVTLGAAAYNGSLWFDGKEGVGLGILQLQTGNALQVSQQIRATLDRLQQKFPPGMTYHVAFDSTEFVRESIREVVITLLVAVLLVVL